MFSMEKSKRSAISDNSKMKYLIIPTFVMFLGACGGNPENIKYPTKPGKYRIGDWEYMYKITGQGRVLEQRIGILKHKGIEILGQPGEIKDTVFGKFIFLTAHYKGWLNTLSHDQRVFDEKGNVTKEVDELLRFLKQKR